MSFDSVKDSGSRQEWATGSRRDTRDGKGRFDLIPPLFLRRLARHLENGAVKYGDRNWQLGQPLGRYLDSGMRHIVNLLAGDVDEDHAAAVAWNAMAFMCTAEWIKDGALPEELDDLGYVARLREQEQADVEEEADEFATSVITWPQRVIVGTDIAGMSEEELGEAITSHFDRAFFTTENDDGGLNVHDSLDNAVNDALNRRD